MSPSSMTKIAIGLTALCAAAGAVGCSEGALPGEDPPTWGVPISGGNMLVSADGNHAWVADPDRDRVMDVALPGGKTTVIALTAGDEPGRLVEDAAGRVHVALRRGGALVTIQSDAIIARRPVCAEPRGVAYDATTDLVHVACSTGELVSLPAAGGAATRSVVVDRDLRDVLVRSGTLYVTRFHTAEVIQLDGSGAIVSRTAPPVMPRVDFGDEEGVGISSGSGSSGEPTVDATPAVAWRTIALPGGQFAMSHQRQLAVTLSTVMHGGYGTGCGGPIEPDISLVGTDGTITPMVPIFGDALPIDLAASADGTLLAVAYAGGQMITLTQIASLVVDNAAEPSGVVCPTPVPGTESTGGVDPVSNGVAGGGEGVGGTGTGISDQLGAPTSVAFTPSNQLLVYYPELPGIAVHNSDGTTQTVLTLPGDVGYDAGRELFHMQTPSGLACASCHPEARDDGLVWTFDTEGQRRTQNVAGSILSRAPYHWAGDMPSIPVLMDDVFADRMGGATPSDSAHRMLGLWLNRVNAPAALAGVDPAAAARGQTLFQSTGVGCQTCHTGTLLSTFAIVDVGTGGAFKVPSLVGVNGRAPYLHDGRAATLLDRFGATGGGDLHGHTSQLTPDQLSDLVAYLETL